MGRFDPALALVLGGGYAPSIDLNFLTGQLDPRISFTRATNASYFDSTGTMQIAGSGVPRFDYDPVTLACRGLLIEEQRTNLLTYSETIDAAAGGWIKGANLTANGQSGTLFGRPAWSFTSTASSNSYIKKNATVAAGTTYTATFYTDTNSGGSSYVRTEPSLTGFNFSYTLVSAGVYRATVSFTVPHGDTIAEVHAGRVDAPSSTTFRVTAAQLEAGAFPTSYIPTTTSAATRNADVAQINGAAFASIWNQSEGTVVCEYELGADNTSVTVFRADDASDNNYVWSRYSSGSAAQYAVNSGGGTAASLEPFGYSSPGVYKRAFAFRADNYQQAINGALPTAEDTAGAAPSGITRCGIGCTPSGVENLNGYIRRIRIYKRRLPNAMLQSLTS